MKVLKKNGSIAEFDSTKIFNAIQKSGDRVGHTFSTQEKQDVLEHVVNNIGEKNLVTVEELHELVLKALYDIHMESYVEYRAYRNYKTRFNKDFGELIKTSKAIIFNGDKENANKESALDSTKIQLISENSMKQMMISYELNPTWTEAHQQGYIHIHDIGSRYLQQQNCCVFDMGNLLSGGFELNGIFYEEPKTADVAIRIIGDVILSASSCQYGGFSVPDLDLIMEKYIENTYKEIRLEMERDGVSEEMIAKNIDNKVYRLVKKAYRGLETKIATISNALGQTSFTTISFGLGTSKYARIMSNAMLDVRNEGLGKNGNTPIFPKLIFHHREEINGAENSPNYDLKLKAIDVSLNRIYPDWLSHDNGYLKEVFEECGEAITPMGCRSFLSPFYNNGKFVTKGRGNLGVITLDLPLYAVECGRDINKFYEMIDKYVDMAIDIHRYTFEQVAKKKGSSNPLMYCEGGAWKSVGYDEEIRPILEAYTYSIGYIGLEEVCYALFGDGLKNHVDFGVEVLEHIDNRIKEARDKYNLLFSLYASPAESLIYRFRNIIFEKHGKIDNVTTRLYLTNSHHIHVTEKVNLIEKQLLEQPMFNISTGGRIMYNEYPIRTNKKAVLQGINHAMKLGLYYGVNTQNDTCNDCNYMDDFKGEDCPKCGSDNVTSINRCCGYLSFEKIKGDTRYNKGKAQEIKDRVDHI